MADGDSLLNKQQRKKVARKKRKQSERAAHRNLDEVTGQAIEQAMALLPVRRAVALDVDLASLSEAEFVRKRVNEALRVDEWLDEVRVWIWQRESEHQRALSPAGSSSGIELRMAPRI